MNSTKISIIPFLALSACTPLARAQGLTSVGAAACATGRGASAAGASWGEIVSSAGCYLADLGAGWVERASVRELAAAEKLKRALEAAELEQTEERITKVAQTHAACLALDKG